MQTGKNEDAGFCYNINNFPPPLLGTSNKDVKKQHTRKQFFYSHVAITELNDSCGLFYFVRPVPKTNDRLVSSVLLD